MSSSEHIADAAELGVVVIGRNEGERLRACLESLRPMAATTVYVDSGSTDGSVRLARQFGVQVLELDAARPFTAARARREGAARLLAPLRRGEELGEGCTGVSSTRDPASHSDSGNHSPGISVRGRSIPEFIFFIDGDCRMNPDWGNASLAELRSRPDLGAVCGRRRELQPNASWYNELCDFEWDTPRGDCDAVGGDAVYRASVYFDAGGFDASVSAGEEPELCQRIRRQGWKLARIDAEMTVHDAAMTHFSQWWLRQVRTGYGGSDVERRFHLGQFDRLLRGAMFWTLLFPIGVAAGAVVFGRLFGLAGVAAIAAIGTVGMAVQILRIARWARRRGRTWPASARIAVLTMLAKPAIVLGMWRSQRGACAGRRAEIIEYKRPTSKPASVNR